MSNFLTYRAENLINSAMEIEFILDVDPVSPKIRKKKKESNVWL
jgi:hypothetical protein